MTDRPMVHALMMNTFKITAVLLAVILVSSCGKDSTVSVDDSDNLGSAVFSVDEHNILKDEVPFKVKGVVYVPGYPGYLPWEMEYAETLPENLRNSIETDLTHIKEMGANTVRFWGVPKYCYEALKNVGGLYFIQTIWISVEESDYQNPVLKENTKAYIRDVVDRIYSVFDDNEPPIIAYVVGNELSYQSIVSTNNAHPEINNYTGNYIVTDSNRTATEVFLAEMADYTRTYEFETYGNKTLLTYANEIRTVDIIDVPFLDFISHNAYSYAVPYYRPDTSPGSSTGTLFQGWIEEIKSKHPTIPLLITETGLSVSPNAYHAGPPNYGYGGNTEHEQATGMLQNLEDSNTSLLPTAGVCIHEYLDAWWKFGLQDSYTQDPDDIEEWFGIAALKDSGDWYSTEFRESYKVIKNEWE
jgi:hypothetical protein